MIEINEKTMLMLYKQLDNLSGEECEEIALFLLKNKQLLNTFPEFKRKNCKGMPLAYRANNSKRTGEVQVKVKDEQFEKTGKPRRQEEHIAMELFRKWNKRPHPDFGYILDYQTPLGGNLTYLCPEYILPENFSVSKMCIDLISYLPEKKEIYVLELKKPSNKEPMLRCVMEGYTYLSVLDKRTFLENMQGIYKDLDIPDDVEFKASPLVYKNGIQHQQYADEEKFPYLNALMKELDVMPIFLEYDD